MLVSSLCLGLFVYQFSQYVWFFCVHLLLLICLIFLCVQFVYWMYLVLPLCVFSSSYVGFWLLFDVFLTFFLHIFGFPLRVLSHPWCDNDFSLHTIDFPLCVSSIPQCVPNSFLHAFGFPLCVLVPLWHVPNSYLCTFSFPLCFSIPFVWFFKK